MRYSNSIIFKIIFVSLFVFNISLAESVARLIKAEGVVKIKRFGMQTYNEIAQVGGSINNGDAIKVGDYGYAAIAYNGIIHLVEEDKYSTATSLFIPE